MVERGGERRGGGEVKSGVCVWKDESVIWCEG